MIPQLMVGHFLVTRNSPIPQVASLAHVRFEGHSGPSLRPILGREFLGEGIENLGAFGAPAAFANTNTLMGRVDKTRQNALPLGRFAGKFVARAMRGGPM